MNDEHPLLSLLRVFVPISLVAVGGGNSVLAEIQRQSVDVHHWLTRSQFLDAFAISRAAPGPGSMYVTLIGERVAGLPGALVASLALFVPSSILVYALARIWRHHRDASWRAVVERGLAPVAAGLILAGVLTLLRSVEGGVFAYLVAGLSLAMLLRTKVNPLVILAGGGVLFALAGAIGLAV